jgi:hypothetical protein
MATPKGIEVDVSVANLHFKKLRRANRASSLSQRAVCRGLTKCPTAFCPPKRFRRRERFGYDLSFVVSFDAVVFELGEEFGEVGVIASFDSANDTNGGDIAAGKRTLMHDLFNARAGSGYLAGEIGQAAGPIADNGGESAEAAIGDKAALDDAAQDVWIDVAAGEKQNGPFAGKFVKLI